MTKEEFLNLKEGDIVVVVKNFRSENNYCRVTFTDINKIWGFWYNTLEKLKKDLVLKQNSRELWSFYESVNILELKEKKVKVYGISKFIDSINKKEKICKT
jgi:hypothetical protein